jgi:D-alanine-D-alanine ligase
MGRWHGKKVALLHGGRSAEREVSLRTGAGCAEALRSRGYDVALIDAGVDVAERLRAAGAAVAFLALHGRWGEDGCIQGLLESMDVPYTGSGVLASALGMNKTFSKLLFREHGLSVADYVVISRERASLTTPADLPFGLPAVVKPSCEGSSVGVQIAHDGEQLRRACVEAARYQGDVLAERYVRGTEVHVAVLDGEPLGAIEVVPSGEFYDYASKYTAGKTQYFFPARIPAESADRVARAAQVAYRAIGCSGVARVDFILTAAGEPHVLEVNTLPGMTPTSLVPKIAAGKGISFADLCERLLYGASLKA